MMYVSPHKIQSTLLGTDISHPKVTFEDDFPLSKVGCVGSLEGNALQQLQIIVSW